MLMMHTWQREIDGCALPITFAHLRELPCPWIRTLLVRAHKKHILVSIENVVGAISMVHVKVKDHHLRRTADLMHCGRTAHETRTNPMKGFAMG